MKIQLNKIYFEVKNNIGYVVMDDPPANKMTALFLKELILLVRKHVTISNVKGIIITGNGRHFSSGADVDQLKEIVATQSMVDENKELVAYPVWYLDNRTTFNYFHTLNIPVISAVNGFCIGSGLELALCSHIRICGKGSMLGLPESSFGFLPGVTGTLRYSEIMGYGKALELVLSGETLSAEDALKNGFMDGIVGKKETLAYCEQLLNYILENEKEYTKEKIKSYIQNFNEIYYSSGS